jgi:LysM repeat protein
LKRLRLSRKIIAEFQSRFKGGHVFLRRIALSLLLIALLALPSTLRADGPTYHTVAWGETLYSIARSFGVSPQALASANALTVNSWVYAGQVLTIPGASGGGQPNVTTGPQKTPSGVYTIRAGDTLSSIAQQFGLSVDTLAAANDLPANGWIYSGWQLKIPTGGINASRGNSGIAPTRAATTSTAYIVQPGDNLFRIALRYGTSTQALALANNLSTYFVFSGQRLIIPGASASSAPSVANVSNAPSAPSSSLNLRVGGIPLYKQQQTLTCEEAAAAMALRGALSEAQIVRAMPRSDNPFAGIRGSTNYPLYGGLTNYGTYAQGLQKGLAALGRASTVLYGQAYADFKSALISNLKAGRAVIWWTTWRQTYQQPVSVKISEGTITLVPYEHSVVIVAANDAGVTYDDPYDATVRFTSWANLQRVSAYFNNMALVVQ